MAVFTLPPPPPKLKFVRHLQKLKTNTLQIYNPTVYFNAEVSALIQLSSYPYCNIHLIAKFYIGLKYTRAVTSAVLQKIGQWGKILMMRIQMGWSSVRGDLESCFQWRVAGVVANIQRVLVFSGRWYSPALYLEWIICYKWSAGRDRRPGPLKYPVKTHR